MGDDIVKEHGGTLFATAIGLVIASAQWLLGREIKRRDVDFDHLKMKQEDQEARIRALEVDRVTRGDMTFLNQRLDGMVLRAEERHVELLDRINQP